MSNIIPPLLCSTPPPIDFDDDNQEEFGTFASADGEVGQYDESSFPATPENKPTRNDKIPDLPIPDTTNISIYPNECDIDTLSNKPVGSFNTQLSALDVTKWSENDIKTSEATNSDDINKTNNYAEVLNLDVPETEDSKSPNLSRKSSFREDSPRSLELCAENITDDDIDSIGDFQTAAVINVDDNISLSSLKFDSIGISKMATSTFYETKFSDDCFAEFPNTNSLFSAFEPNLKDETFSVKQDDSNNELPESLKSDDISKDMQNEIENQEKLTDFCSNYDDTLEEFVLSDGNKKVEEQENAYSDKSLHMERLNSIEEISSSHNETGFKTDFNNFPVYEDNISTYKTNNQVLEKLNVNPNKKSESNRDINDDGDDDDDDDDFEDFQDFKTAQNTTILKGNDDDFGALNDVAEISRDTDYQINNLNSKVKNILSMMFAYVDKIEENNIEESFKPKFPILNGLTNDLKEIDSAKALNYQWKNSNMKHSLIKALGIDSRNILYGEKWNSSMPRFAANLGFNPLEPIKPENTTPSIGNNFKQSIKKENLMEKIASHKTEVPAVQFDWNSAGLVNPLDGIKEILHERNIDPVQSSQSCNIITTDSEQKQLQETVMLANLKSPSNINNDLKDLLDETTTNKVINPDSTEKNGKLNENKILSSSILNSTSSPTLLNTTSNYSVPLKETHIFTPSKTENPIIRNVKPSDKYPIDFDYEMAAAGIIINEQVVKKEYRDIEYNPVMNLNELQTSIDPEINLKANDDENVNTNIRLPHLNDKINLECQKIPDSYSEIEIISSDENTINNITNGLNINTANDLTNDFCDFQYEISNDRNVTHFIGPVIGISPSEKSTENQQELPFNSNTLKSTNDKLNTDKNSLDDEFSDFQYVPPPITIDAVVSTHHHLKSTVERKSGTSTPTLNDEMILSPAVLLPQALVLNSSPQINWPEPGINSNDLARLEELYPQSDKSMPIKNSKYVHLPEGVNRIKINQKSTNNDDDDDWSDFISVPANAASTTQKSNYSNSPIKIPGPNINKTNSTKQTGNDLKDDDWSDFISNIPSSNHNIQLTNTGPSFIPWNSALETNRNTTELSASSHFNAWNQSFYKTPSTESQISYPKPTQNVQMLNNIVPTQNFSLNNNTNQYSVNDNQYKNIEYYELPKNHPELQQRMNSSNQNQNMLNRQGNKLASIAVIPNLEFVAPKHFINIPKPNFNKK